jgi:hypothetical protein
VNRSIKFRAWDKIYKHFHTGDLVREYVLGDFIDNKEYEVTQFTGLTDKKGVEIFEGDLIKEETGIILKIFYENGSFIAGGLTKLGNEKYTLVANCNKTSEVIGNIYENSELNK